MFGGRHDRDILLRDHQRRLDEAGHTLAPRITLKSAVIVAAIILILALAVIITGF
jgi:hypothetical protein